MGKKITLKDVADRAKLSVPAVSRAIAGHRNISSLTRKRVLAICDELDYRPSKRTSRSTSSRPQSRVGLVLVDVGRMAPHAMHWLTKLTEANRHYGMSLELAGIDSRDDAQWHENLRAHAQGKDALLLFGYLQPPVLEAVTQLRPPCVLAGDHARVRYAGVEAPSPVHRVTMDAFEMGRTATDMLLACGHKRVGFFCAPFAEGSWNDQWMNGYRLALMRAGLSDDPSLRMVLDSPVRREVGVIAADRMLAIEKPPTAFVVPAVLAAVRFYETLAQRDITLQPDQLVMGGIADEIAGTALQHFPLIAQDMTQMASYAIDLVDRVVAGKDLPRATITVPFTVLNQPAAHCPPSHLESTVR